MTRDTKNRAPRLGLRDLLDIGTVGLRSRKLRAALSALGIAIGVGTVVVVASIPASSQAALDAQLTQLGTNLLRVDPQAATQTDAGPQQVKLPQESMQMVLRIGPVTGAAEVGNTHTEVRRNSHVDQADGGISVLAVQGDLRRLLRTGVSSGSFLSPGVLPTAVLGAGAAERLGIPRILSQPVTIELGDATYNVVGILRSTPLSADIDRAVLVGWESAQHTLGFDGRPTVVYATGIESQLEQVRGVLASTLSPEASGLVTVSRVSDALHAKRASQNTFSGLFLGLAAVSLLVGAVGVANTMFVSVLERRREIGLRRALGAHRGQIRDQFLVESTTLSLLGGLAGCAVGALAATGWALAHRWPVVIPLDTVLIGVLASLMAGMLAGLIPSIRASRVTPTAALATE